MHTLRHILAVLLGGVLLAAAAEPAHAFKIHTHVWLADQLAHEINASGGRVSIKGRQYQLDTRVAAAIQKDPGAFVMGTLGADIYPDMFAGQMTTHPGVNPEGAAPGWQTDDWINHVVNAAMRSNDDSSIAFAAGYMLHAAMDMWAHSYVNLYSGDVFAILENSEAAQRHVALESYLTKFHVNLRDVYPHSTHYDRYSAMRAPAEFVRKTLILNPNAAREYARSPSTGTIYYDQIYRYYLAAKRSQASNLTLASLLQEELDRINPLLDQLPGLKAQIDAKQQAFDGHLMRLVNTAQSVLSGAGDVLANSGIQAALDAADIDIDLDGPAIAAQDALDIVMGQYRTVTNQIGYNVAGFYDPQTIRNTLNAAIDMTAGGAVIDKWPGDIEKAVDAWVRAWEDTGRHLMRPHDLSTRDPLRPMQVWAKCWGPVLFPMTIPPEIQALPVTCEQGLATVDRVRTDFNTTLEQLKNLIPGRMQLQQALAEVEEHLMAAVEHHATEALDAFGAAMPNEQIAQVSGELPSDPTGLATWLVRMWDSHTTAGDVDQAYENTSALKPYVAQPVTPALHWELQVCDNQSTKAVAYTDAPIADFAPVQNAMTMSKLALLSASGLNGVISGQVKLTRGTTASSSLSRTVLNTKAQSSINTRPYRSRLPMGAVLIGAIRSIDGDHPWQPTAPPLPRRVQPPTPDEESCRRFGYPAGNAYAGGDCTTDNLSEIDLQRKSGMILWQQPYRDLVFNELFQPIATSLCAFAGYDYPHAACHGSEVPFPEYVVPDNEPVAQTRLRRQRPSTRAAKTLYSDAKAGSKAARVASDLKTPSSKISAQADSQTRRPSTQSAPRVETAPRAQRRTEVRETSRTSGPQQSVPLCQ